VFVSPQGLVFGSLDPETRITNIVFKLHGELLLGTKGAWLVELAGSWAIVMLLTGLFLWWPKSHRGGRGLAGVLWPRLHLGKRAFWRDLHAVTGFWVSGFALVLLITALPWANVWGQVFADARAELGWVKGHSDWAIAGKAEYAAHDHSHMDDMAMNLPMPPSRLSLSDIVAKAQKLNLDFPVLIRAPGANGAETAEQPDAWTVKSETQNRPRRVTVLFDAATGRELSRINFADQHPLDRAVSYGIAWHEGQLLGWINQLIGLLTALALIAMTVSGFVLWWRRKPRGLLGAPIAPRNRADIAGVAVVACVFAVLLPMLALSLAAILAAEWLVLRHLPRVRQ
jgi:uncharacterized iron-regulated membrane protein